MINLKKDIQDINRFKEILGIVFEEGFDALLQNLKLKKFVPMKKKIIGKPDKKLTNEERFRKTLERLGPTFVKFGQLLSIRPDYVPKSYIKELEKLQDKVPPFKDAKNIIEKSTGKKINEIFKKFNEKPFASASIAQVHKAVLKNNEVVAVKVKRPDIETIIKKDIEIMFFVAKLIKKHIKPLSKYQPVKIVGEFSDWSKRELNFTVEAENQRMFYENFKESLTTKIPRTHDEFCNENIIVMEYIEGTELQKLGTKKDINFKQALKNGFYSILEQVFVHGLFHGDPHPSNILVLKDNRVSFVDFGIVGRFDEHLKNCAVDLLLGMSEGDTDKVIEALCDMGIVAEGDIDNFREKVSYAILPLKAGNIKDIKISKVLENVLDIALVHDVKIPREFVIFGKAIVTIEGIALLYYPDFRFVEMVRPFLKDIVAEKYKPKNIVKDTLKSLIGLKKIVEKLPRQTSRVLDKLEKGMIKIEMKDTDIQRLSIELDKSSNRLTYGMIIAALLISGSLVVNVGESVFYGLPLLSLLNFFIAGLFGFVLLISIYRENL